MTETKGSDLQLWFTVGKCPLITLPPRRTRAYETLLICVRSLMKAICQRRGGGAATLVSDGIAMARICVYCESVVQRMRGRFTTVRRGEIAAGQMRPTDNGRLD